MKRCETKTSLRLCCEADHVYVRIRPEHGASQMLPMHRDGDEQWKLSVPLERGTYHFRYYYIAPGGKLMMYHPADELNGKMEGLDGVLRVGDGLPPREVRDGCAPENKHAAGIVCAGSIQLHRIVRRWTLSVSRLDEPLAVSVESMRPCGPAEGQL